MRLAVLLLVQCLVLAATNGVAAEGLLGSLPAKPTGNEAAVPDAGKPVAPDSATAAIQPFYKQIGLELDPAERSRFIDPAKSVLDASEALEKSGQGECLDPNMALDNAGGDKAQIDKSLRMAEAVKGDDAKVIVAFEEDGAPHRLEWKLKKVEGAWKITDLLSVTGEWALSQYQCQ